MRIIMVMVATINGKITRDDVPDNYQWTSKEDQKHFSSLLKKNNLLVMGRKTYKAVRKNMKLKSGQLRVILTRHPIKYRTNAVPGKLEFSDESPRQLIKRLENKGFRQMLVLGGGAINALFLEENLVDELSLTVEPQIFGTGKPLVAEGEFVTSLQLVSMKRLNQNGTLLLKYKISHS